ncbi:alpha/beta-Hydrolases superfamily protein [Striga asiatica]|uniref:Alpha/beta-Hydrolases superfamily protein n=1 Tax=Striga asiatica TaxID=4170 RepID=A0A5A7Q4R6_STRAF|nr:alpha/beta-Hydrolases superfamily protein [Striga asiatica]
MACEEEEEDSFCDNYLVIKPEKASLLDLFRILFSRNLERRDFFNCPEEGVLSRFDHRWIVFISLLVQKVLLFIKIPLAAVGTVVEFFLNLPAANGGCRRLFFNLLTDYQQTKTTNAMIFQNKNVGPNLITVAFRGTEPFNTDDWRTDVDISWYEFKGVGKIHGGFMKALGLQKCTGWPKEIPTGPAHKPYAYYTIRERLRTLIHENSDAKFMVTGHSLGGALAILFAGVLAIHDEKFLLSRMEGVYTFGQPRVGNEQFGEYMKKKLRDYSVKYFRYVYNNDLVPRLPYDDKAFMFKHFGPCLYFNSCYKGFVLEEEPNKNYFSLFYVVPKILTAVYQLIRSFILPWRRGKDYREGWLMKLLRVFALVIPGFTDHVLVDYVNSTRLGKLPSVVYPGGPNQVLKQH